MSFLRYFFAISLSLIIHSFVLWVAPQNKAMAMPAGVTTTSVSINFVSAPAAPPTKAVKKTTEEVKKTVNKEIEKVKPLKSVPKKSAKKVTKKPVKPEQVVAKKTVSKEEVTKEKVIKNKEKQPEKITDITETPKKAVSPLASSGVSNKLPLIEKASFLSKPTAPKYPRLARKKGVEGTATYEIWLNEQGEQIKQILASSSGARMLDNAALSAIKKWQFSPQKINGQAIAHRIFVPVRFKLD